MIERDLYIRIMELEQEMLAARVRIAELAEEFDNENNCHDGDRVRALLDEVAR